jgi:glycosyltransferase domain-containing protein
MSNGATERELTVLLTLKDRTPYTARWMSYADETGFPFKVLIADGGSDDAAAQLLADRDAYPRVDYEYVRYAPDRSYADYYAKIVDALERVQTRFVVLADNDDFFFVDALRESVRFLSDNPEYVSCGGQGAIFWVEPAGNPGDNERAYGNLAWKCTRELHSIDGDTASGRIRGQAVSTADTFFYDVRRTGDARRHFTAVRDLNPRDIFIFEHVVCFLSAIAGKAKRLDALYLARQQNSPGSSGGTHAQTFGDWFGRMLVESWSEDFTRFLNATSAELARVDGLSATEARDCILRSYRMLVAPALLSNLLEEQTVTPPMAAFVPLVRRLVRLPEKSPLKRAARALYRRLPWVSLDAVYGTEFVAGSVPGAERTMELVRRFLREDRFQPDAPQLRMRQP